MSLSTLANLRLPDDEIEELLLRVRSPPSSVEAALSQQYPKECVRGFWFSLSVAAYAERVSSVVTEAAAATAKEGGVPGLGVMGGVGSSKVEAFEAKDETEAEVEAEAKVEAEAEAKAKAKLAAEAEAEAKAEVAAEAEVEAEAKAKAEAEAKVSAS